MLLWVVSFCSVKVTYNCVIMIGQYPQSHKVIETRFFSTYFLKLIFLQNSILISTVKISLVGNLISFGKRRRKYIFYGTRASWCMHAWLKNDSSVVIALRKFGFWLPKLTHILQFRTYDPRYPFSSVDIDTWWANKVRCFLEYLSSSIWQFVILGQSPSGEMFSSSSNIKL